MFSSLCLFPFCWFLFLGAVLVLKLASTCSFVVRKWFDCKGGLKGFICFRFSWVRSISLFLSFSEVTNSLIHVAPRILYCPFSVQKAIFIPYHSKPCF